MEEITAVVRNNTETATTAAKMINGAADTAARGGQVVGEVVTTMEQISDASQRISEIIVMIDSISFQTNILALNAAVEAARAGSRGVGSLLSLRKCGIWRSVVRRLRRRLSR